MKKVKWLYADWPLPISDISKILLSNQYSDGRGHGFVLSSSGGAVISGKYIEKSFSKSIISDPFGNEVESIVVSYYVSKFNISESSLLIELIDPPRSLRKFISRMHSLLGLGLELSDISVDPLVWLQRIESITSDVVVSNISSSGIRVQKDGLAKISVSGKKDIRHEFSNLVGGKNRNIDTIKFSGFLNECNISVELEWLHYPVPR